MSAGLGDNTSEAKRYVFFENITVNGRMRMVPSEIEYKIRARSVSGWHRLYVILGFFVSLTAMVFMIPFIINLVQGSRTVSQMWDMCYIWVVGVVLTILHILFYIALELYEPANIKSEDYIWRAINDIPDHIDGLYIKFVFWMDWILSLLYTIAHAITIAFYIDKGFLGADNTTARTLTFVVICSYVVLLTIQLIFGIIFEINRNIVISHMGADGEVDISSFTSKSGGGQILLKTTHIRESGAAPADMSELFSKIND